MRAGAWVVIDNTFRLLPGRWGVVELPRGKKLEVAFHIWKLSASLGRCGRQFRSRWKQDVLTIVVQGKDLGILYLVYTPLTPETGRTPRQRHTTDSCTTVRAAGTETISRRLESVIDHLLSTAPAALLFVWRESSIRVRPFSRWSRDLPSFHTRP